MADIINPAPAAVNMRLMAAFALVHGGWIDEALGEMEGASSLISDMAPDEKDRWLPAIAQFSVTVHGGIGKEHQARWRELLLNLSSDIRARALESVVCGFEGWERMIQGLAPTAHGENQ
jgi:hypothetical protein